MKFTGSLLSKSKEDTNSPSLSRHYVCCVLNIYSSGSAADGVDEQTNPEKKIRRRYAQKNLGSAQRLSASQVILGLLIIGCQLAPSYWQISVISAASNKVDLGISRIDNVQDVILPGIWGGLFVLVTGIVGLVAVAKNSRCLIVTHLVLNSFAVLFALAVTVMSGVSLNGIATCKMDATDAYIERFNNQGNDYRYNGYGYNHHHNNHHNGEGTSTTTPSPITLFGEVFKYSGGRFQIFHCTDSIFTVWIVMEAVITVSSLIALALTIALIVKNSKALSLCCRTCCTVDEEKEVDADDASLLTV